MGPGVYSLDRMRVAIVTGMSAIQQHLCARLASMPTVEVVAIVLASRRPRWARAAPVLRQAPLSHVLTHSPVGLAWNRRAAMRRAVNRLVPAGTSSAMRGMSALTRVVSEVNEPGVLSWLRERRPQLVVCFGGPRYAEEWFSCAPLVLNYHTGLAPLYAGAASPFFAFANGHISLCGGTLMKLAGRIDGGDVLSHALPAIEDSDDPATLFVKSALEGANLVGELCLGWEREGFEPTVVSQPAPFLYYRSHDWRLGHVASVARLLRRGAIVRARRSAVCFHYWKLPPAEAAALLQRNLLEWISSGEWSAA
jgi:hypothetical protein